MGMEARGTIHAVFETKQISERFTKREFVVEIADNPRYPQLVSFQATGDRCAQLDGLGKGDEVIVEFSLRGREWTSPTGEVKYFNTLDVWKVEVTKKTAPATTAAGGGGASAEDDIPFASSDFAREPSAIARWWR